MLHHSKTFFSFGLCAFLLGFFSQGACAQSPKNIDNISTGDSTLEISIISIIDQVINYHPLVKSANLQVDLSESNIIRARGSFDPQIQFNQQKKQFNDINYFNIQNLQLSNATRAGLKLMAGTEYASGNYLDPMNYVGNAGLNYIGIELPILKDLLIDKKRADLQKTKIYNQMSVAERDVLVNQIIYSAIDLYCDWLVNHESVIAVNQIVNNAIKRKSALISLFNHGAATSIDTLETHVQLSQYEAKLTELKWKTLKSKILLNSLLWTSNNIPVELDSWVIPTNQYIEYLDSMVSYWKQETQWKGETMETQFSIPPTLKIYQNKINISHIQLQLSKNNLLPDLNLKYQYLQPINSFNFASFTPNNNNKIGVTFSSPLVRSAVSEYKIAQYQKQQSELEYVNKKREISQKSDAYFKEIEVAKSLEKQWTEIAGQTQQLYQMELKRLEAGDVNFFVINTRETRVFDQNVKALDAKLNKLKKSNELLLLLGYP